MAEDTEVLLPETPSEAAGVEVETPAPEAEVEVVAAPPEQPKPADEVSEYSEKVQKRIKELTWARHEAERQQAAALDYAKAVQQQNEALRKSLETGHQILATTAKGKAESELSQAKRQYKEAYDLGNGEAMAEAAALIAKIENESQRVQQFASAPAPQIPQIQPPRPQVPQPDGKAEAWRQRNGWFGNDSAMTGYALGFHQALVGRGVDPDSDDYYQSVDAEMRKRFPEKFEAQPQPDKPAPRRIASAPVAPTSRTGNGGRNKITLTASEVAVADRLRPSYVDRDTFLKEYAKQLGRES